MSTPFATPARFPAEYGQTDESRAELLPWVEVADRIGASLNYLMATTTPEGRPHLRPVDGVFVQGALCFGGSPETRWVRHLQERPAITVGLPDDDNAVILEGDVTLVTDPSSPLSVAVGEANRAKYPQYYAGEEVTEPLPFWCLYPQRVFAWSLTGFPKQATRFDFT